MVILQCLGVFRLSFSTTQQELEKQFGRFGQIKKCQVVQDHYSGCYVYLETAEQVEEAKKQMDGQELDGRKVWVDFSTTNGPHTSTRRPSRERYSKRERRYNERDR